MENTKKIKLIIKVSTDTKMSNTNLTGNEKGCTELHKKKKKKKKTSLGRFLVVWRKFSGSHVLFNFFKTSFND